MDAFSLRHRGAASDMLDAFRCVTEARRATRWMRFRYVTEVRSPT
jgi:hypothetical protein